MKSGILGLLAACLVGAATVGSPAQAFNVGDVFASTGDGRVRVYSSTGAFIQELNTGLGGYTTGSAFDSAGNFYVTSFSTGSVVKFDSTGALVNASWSTGMSAPESIVFSASGDAYIGTAGANQIRRVSSSGATLQTYTGLASNTDWIDLAADQTTMIYSAEENTLRRWDVGTNSAMSNFGVGPGVQFYAKRFMGNGDLLVAASNGSVYRFSSSGVLSQTYATGLGSVFALNLDPDGTSFWTGVTGGQLIRRFDIGTGNQLASWSTGVGTLFGLAVFGEITAGCGTSCEGGGGSVPEPGTFALLGLGLAVLGLSRRRRAN